MTISINKKQVLSSFKFQHIIGSGLEYNKWINCSVSLWINFKPFFKICLIEGFLCSTTNWLTEWLKPIKSQLDLLSSCWQDKFKKNFYEKWLYYKKNVIFECVTSLSLLALTSLLGLLPYFKSTVWIILTWVTSLPNTLFSSYQGKFLSGLCQLWCPSAKTLKCMCQ